MAAIDTLDGAVNTDNEPEFTVIHQSVQLNLDIAAQKLKGSTQITIAPQSSDLRVIRLHCQQASISKCTASVGKAAPSFACKDPYQAVQLPYRTDAHQHQVILERIENQLLAEPVPQLTITLPKNIRIPLIETPAELMEIDGGSGATVQQYAPITITIDYTIDKIRDGLRFVGWDAGDMQCPHVYTTKVSATSTSCLFPCVARSNSRCTWDISIKTPRTVGDAIRVSKDSQDPDVLAKNKSMRFLPEDKALDLLVICSGDLSDEIIDHQDSSKKTTSFRCDYLTAPQHINFAIGPFKHVNLAEFREADEDEKLGKNAIPLHGFCLPKREEEVTNTCLPLARAIDHFLLTYGAYPFTSYKICFVDDMAVDHADGPSLTLCSSRILIPATVQENLYEVTRKLVYAIACQWIGVNITPAEPSDTWITVGIAYYITDIFMRKLCGNNEYRFRLKSAMETLCDLDIDRPTLAESGQHMHVDECHLKFIELKAPLVMYILDRNILKKNQTSGISRIISKILLNYKTGDLADGTVSTAYFQRLCEKTGHIKLDLFFAQWVNGAGCPQFLVTQRFNKKRLLIEMQITQRKIDRPTKDLESETFFRDLKEELSSVYAGDVQPFFSGSMTIRIHEADGTPYDHVVEIKEQTTRVDIPYNTKYRRLGRGRKKLAEKQAAALNASGDAADGVPTEEGSLIYCLGDVLQGEDDVRDWKLTEWSKEDEERMAAESYEWIRMDADFEWICKMNINMPAWMFVSQLQQDRDVVAQLESIQWIAAQREATLAGTFLCRTMMDKRYFHGIREAATLAMAKHTKEDLQWVGLHQLLKAYQESFCVFDTDIPRPNDFSDRAESLIQIAILQTLSMLRDSRGRSPFLVRKFLYEKLRLNDNSNNEFSDAYLVSTLMTCLATTTSVSPQLDDEMFDEPSSSEDNFPFFKACLSEIDRHKRMDEWIPSHHNLITTTALDCATILAKARRAPVQVVDLLQYTQPGCSPQIRIKAVETLLELGFFNNEFVLRYVLFMLASDPSFYVRDNVLRLLTTNLGAIAIGKSGSSDLTTSQPDDMGGLILETDDTAATSARAALIARRETIPGALAALGVEVSGNETLKKGLWNAVLSQTTTIKEKGDLLTLCSVLYDEEQKMLMVFKYPKYWGVQSQGRSKNKEGKTSHMMKFYRIDKYRTRPRKIKPVSLKIAMPKPSFSTSAAPLITPNGAETSGKMSPPERKPTVVKFKQPKKPGTISFSNPAASSPIQKDTALVSSPMPLTPGYAKDTFETKASSRRGSIASRRGSVSAASPPPPTNGAAQAAPVKIKIKFGGGAK